MGALYFDSRHAPTGIETEHDPSLYAQAAVALIGVENGLIVAYNDGAQMLFRTTREAALGAPFDELFAPSHRAMLRAALVRAERGVPSFPSLLAYRDDSPPTEVDLRIGPLRVGARVIGATVVVLDVRHRNRTIRELRAERDRERARANAAEDALSNAQRVFDQANLADSGSSATRLERTRASQWLEVGSDSEPPPERIAFNVTELLDASAKRAAAAGGAAVRTAYSPTLDGTVEGHPVHLAKLVDTLFDAARPGVARLRGIVQTRRDDWALIRVEIDEPDTWERTADEWALLRRMAVKIEGALGHEALSEGRRRVWLTFNVCR